MEPRLTLITLGVRDLTRSEDFYSNIFGWKKSTDSNKDIIFYKLNGIMLSLFPKAKLAEDAKINADGTGFSGFTLAYNLRSQKEVDDLFLELETSGVNIVKKPEKVFWGGYSGYISDPDGYLWELAFNPFMELDGKGNVK